MKTDGSTILVVDDAVQTVEVLQRNLTSEGYRVFTATGAADAIGILDGTPVDLVITDLKMPKVSGLHLIRHIRENCRDTEVMMITGYPSIEGAVEAVKTGADEYLAKPFTDAELMAAVRRSLEKLHLRRSAHADGNEPPASVGGLVGESALMRKVYQQIGRAAGTLATVLVQGESGTGKELVARAIHYSSSRAAAPFVPVNCGGIPEGLLESALFGHMKGAFTGATESHAGFFHAADGGTVFLDEVSEMSLAMQVKLLRVLQDREVCMVGSQKPRHVDVRILAATNKDLRNLVERSVFREDLYYRLNVISVAVPPLRDRGDDVVALAHHFAVKFAREAGRTPPTFSDRVLQMLKGYDWPGNVRELENLIQRLVVMTEGNLIEAPDLPSMLRFALPRGRGLTRTLAEIEAEHIRHVLDSVSGNKSQAAEILGIDRKTLREKLKGLTASN
jgi:two-component system, NtrC family, response regulator HydG